MRCGYRGQGQSRSPMRGEKDDRPVGAKRKLGTEDPAPRVEDVTEQTTRWGDDRGETTDRGHEDDRDELISVTIKISPLFFSLSP